MIKMMKEILIKIIKSTSTREKEKKQMMAREKEMIRRNIKLK